MKADARHLDQLVREWSLLKPGDDVLFGRILEAALRPTEISLIAFARAFRILETRSHPPAIRKRVERLGERLSALRVREHQVDDLGDLNNEPQTIFDILGSDLTELQEFNPERLRQSRLAHSDSRALAAKALLEAIGWDRLEASAKAELQLAVDDLEEREHYQAWGLFVNSAANEGIALGLNLIVREAGAAHLWSEAGHELTEQARAALRLSLGDRGWEAKIEWPAAYVGESIGVPLYVAGLVASGDLPRHALTASTGRIDIGGHITGVAGIKQKVEAARRVGIRRVLVPRENLADAKAAAADDLVVVPVEHVKELAGAFRQAVSSRELGYSSLIRLVRASVKDYGLLVDGESENANGFRFVVASTSGKANLWIYRNGRVRPDGQSGPVLDAANRLVAERVPADPEQRETQTFQLPTRQLQDRYRDGLQHVGAVDEPPHEHETWRVRLSRGRSRSTVVLYASGKCVIQGTAPAWDEARQVAHEATESIGGLATPVQPQGAQTKRGDVSSSDESEPHIGTDEAGKGDYFGPLVSAAVYVDIDTALKLRQLGVRDSKTLSDKRVRELSRKIKELAEGQYAVTPINPRKFNELYEQFRREGKNLNSLLAWGHGRSIDNLLNVPQARRPPAKFVVVDQFADKHYIEQRTRRAGIPIHQRHKAEADIAVAAASILARDGFLQWIERWSERTQITLPKGASPQVIEAAKQFVRRWGAKWLGDVAKLSFRTTNQVLEGEDINANKPRPPWTEEAADTTREG
jgi:ribonuclease HIII